MEIALLMYDEDKVFEEYGIHPKNFLLFRMFDGDKSDGIPGVNGVGMKTLTKLFPFMKTEQKYTLFSLLVNKVVCFYLLIVESLYRLIRW